MSEEIADVLDNAADLIESKGWIQNAYRDANGYCSVGAIMGVFNLVELNQEDEAHSDEHIDFLTDSAEVALIRKLRDKGAIGVEAGVIGWNDASGRTKQQVLDLFREVAKEQRDTD